MPSLAERVRRLEALVEEFGPNEALQPTYLTLDPAGRVGASFSGKVHAQGLDLDASALKTPTDANRVRWLRSSDQAVAGDIYGYKDDGRPPPGGRPSTGGRIVLEGYTLDSAGGDAGVELWAFDSSNDRSAVLRVIRHAGVSTALARVQVEVTSDDGSTTYTRTILASDGSSDFSSAASLPLVTALPSSPADGQMIAYLVASGVVWLFRYNAGSTSAFKWESIGGPPLVAQVDATEGTSSNSYTALTTAGPSVTPPLDGDYVVEHGAGILWSSSSNLGRMSYDIGATPAADADQILSGALAFESCSRTQVKTGLSAGAALVGKYRADGLNVATFNFRWISLRPLRVG